LPSYEVNAVDEGSKIVVIATTDTASAALIKFRDARNGYRRVWVTDAGSDVPADELLVRSSNERSSS
jgi:hypothetical protein